MKQNRRLSYCNDNQCKIRGYEGDMSEYPINLRYDDHLGRMAIFLNKQLKERVKVIVVEVKGTRLKIMNSYTLR